jgi:RNA polymerase sigma-70 factor, ECF subfamily
VASQSRDARTGTVSPEEASFRALYEAELAYVHRSLRRLGISEAEAEELAHDVFVVVFRKWDEFDRTRPARPWLFGIAYRTAARSLERSWRKHERLIGEAVLEAAPAPPEAAEARDTLLRALAMVEPDQRVVCILHDLDGHPAPEIATMLDVPVNTVYSRLRLGRQRLSSALRQLSRTPCDEGAAR